MHLVSYEQHASGIYRARCGCGWRWIEHDLESLRERARRHAEPEWRRVSVERLDRRLGKGAGHGQRHNSD